MSNANDVLTETEAADFLRISPRKLFDLRKAGAVPFKYVGNQPRYLRNQLAAFLRGEWQPVVTSVKGESSWQA